MPTMEGPHSADVGGATYSVEDDITALLEIGHVLDDVMDALGLDPLDYMKGESVTDNVRAQARAILDAIKRLRDSHV